MSNGWIIFFIFLAVTAVVLFVLYRLGKRAQAKQAEQQAQIDAAAQQISMFIIDKKKMRLKDAGLPDIVMQQAKGLMKMSKVPVLRVKVGPQVTNLICDNAIFDDVPVKKEVKATVSGIYVTAVRGLHGKQPVQTVKKKGKLQQWMDTLQEKAGAKPVK